MIWALLAAYFLGGGLGGVSGSMLTSAAVKQLSIQSEAIIADPERVEAARGTFKDLRKEIKAFERKFGKSGRQLNKDYRNHDAGGEQALAILNGLNSDWETMQLRAIELRFQLRDQMTEKNGPNFLPEAENRYPQMLSERSPCRHSYSFSPSIHADPGTTCPLRMSTAVHTAPEYERLVTT